MLLRLIQESEHGITRDELFAIFNVVGNRGGMQRVQNALVRPRKEGKISVRDGVYTAA